MSPSYNFLESLASRGQLEANFTQPLNPNPSLYKYRWWIFHRGSPCEGDAFLELEHSLSIAPAMALINDLKGRGEPFMVLNRRYPRRPVDGSPPWDMDSPNWKGAIWALNLADDLDPAWKGHR